MRQKFDPCINHSKGPFLEIPGEEFKKLPQKTEPIEGYEAEKDFPNCCPFHTSAIKDAEEWFEKFPDCCDYHRNMASTWKIEKSDYEGLPRKILDCLAFTEHHISKRIERPDWYEDITNYIFYNWWHFGHPNMGGDRYHLYLKHFLEVSTDKIPKAKRTRLIEYIDAQNKPAEPGPKLDLNLLWDTYQKWLKTFPFQLPYFNGLHERLKSTIPVFKEPLRLNPYTGMQYAKVFTQGEMVDFLEATTKRLISEVQTADFEVSDMQKHRLQLSEESLRLGTAKLVQGYSKGELRYVAILKKWLELQKTYFNEVADIMQKPTPSPQKGVILCPAFAALFVNQEAAHRALKAAMSAGIIDDTGKRKLGERKMVSAIVQFWEAISDRKFELTHLRAEKEAVAETYRQQCEAIAEQFGAKISQSATYDHAGKRAGKYFTAVARALGGT